MGSKSQESTSTTKPNPVVDKALQDILARGTAVANQPLQQYTGSMVAGFTPDQQTAFNSIRNAQGMALPFYNQAAQYAAPQKWNEKQLDRYYSPYQSNVIDSAMANINQTNQMQANDLRGNAISSGAFGGDRAGVAQAALAGQQNMTNNSTLAGLQNQGYAQALGQFNTMQDQRSRAAGMYGNIGQAAQQSVLQGAQAQLGAGGMQQALAQQQLNIPYQQFQQQQQYPFYTTNFLSGLLSGVGGLGGGTTTQTSPGPNGLSQALGLAATVAPMFFGLPPMPINTGGRVDALANGGGVEPRYPDLSDVFEPIPQMTPAVLVPPPPPPKPEEEGGDALGGGLMSMLSSFSGMPGAKATTKKMFGKGGKAPQFDVSKFTTMPEIRTAANQPAGTYGMGDWFNPLPQIPLSSMPPPLVTPLPGSITGGSQLGGGYGGYGSGGGGFGGWHGLGARTVSFAEGGRADEEKFWDMVGAPAGQSMPPFGTSFGGIGADELITQEPLADVAPTGKEDQDGYKPTMYPDVSVPDVSPSAAFLALQKFAGSGGALNVPSPTQAGAEGNAAPTTASALPAMPAGASSTHEGLFGTSVGAEGDTWRLPVMQAGLRMMASQSPFVGTALGEGGSYALQQWEARRVAAAEAAREAAAAREKANEPTVVSNANGVFGVVKDANAPGGLRLIPLREFEKEAPERRGYVIGKDQILTGPNGEVMARGPAGDDPAKPPTDAQNLNAMFARRMRAANGSMTGVQSAGTDWWQSALDTFGGNRVISEDRQVFNNAAQDFALAVLRKESGAAISPSEREDVERLYFPRYGDGQRVIEQKQRARESVIKSMEQLAGPALGGAPASTGAMPQPRTQAERDALPPGTKYRTPDGTVGVRQ